LLDRTFGALPAKAKLQPVAYAVPQGLGRRIVTPLDVPQSVVNFGGPGIARDDRDFMAAYIINHILGGGSFSSRLYREVREKRGLAYGVSDSLVWLNYASLLLGSTATRADATGQTIDIIELEICKLAAEGPTEEEFAKAKTYLKGSFASASTPRTDCEPAGTDAARQSRHRPYRAPSCPHRRRDSTMPAGGQAIVRSGSSRHRRRLPEGVSSTQGGVAARPALSLCRGQSPASRNNSRHASVPIPKFASLRGTLVCELLNLGH
jgi:hypothetical protein